jgi:hypothetical protein
VACHCLLKINATPIPTTTINHSTSRIVKRNMGFNPMASAAM